LNEAEQDISTLRKTDFVSSTKIDRLLEILKDLNENHEGEKVIVFSQFVSFLDMLEGPIKHAFGNRSVGRFQGSMNAKARNEMVNKFETSDSMNILLVSLKCGSLGLNLTCANHVVLTDLWWYMRECFDCL
jgi:SNF2 family DNA or RNA helicase